MLNRIFVVAIASTLRGGSATVAHGLSNSSSAQSLVSSQAVACAGKDIRVVTDMGFDDWGAFSVLHAAQCTPTKALATKGMMMPSTFSASFASLLKSWNLDTKVYKGTETCYQSKPCIDDSFIEKDWHYRSDLQKAYSSRAQGPFPKASGVSSDVAEFWKCQPGKKYTLLVLSPMSDVATELSKNAATRGCIEEIVAMGAFFATSDSGKLVLGGKDDETKDALMLGTSPVPEGKVGNTELNLASDIPAAKAVLALGLNMKLMPLEVASIGRAGRQLIKGPYSAQQQRKLTTTKVAELCGPLGKSGETKSMLEGMACIHDLGATLDLDAIAATWLVSRGRRYTLTSQMVSVADKDGETTLCTLLTCPLGYSVKLGWSFDAPKWIDDLKALQA